MILLSCINISIGCVYWLTNKEDQALYYTVMKHDGHIRAQSKEAKNNKTRFFYVLYSDKAWFLTRQSAQLDRISGSNTKQKLYMNGKGLDT